MYRLSSRLFYLLRIKCITSQNLLSGYLSICIPLGFARKTNGRKAPTAGLIFIFERGFLMPVFFQVSGSFGCREQAKLNLSDNDRVFFVRINTRNVYIYVIAFNRKYHSLLLLKRLYLCRTVTYFCVHHQHQIFHATSTCMYFIRPQLTCCGYPRVVETVLCQLQKKFLFVLFWRKRICCFPRI